MTQVNFEVLGEKQVSQMLSRTTDKAADLGPYWLMVQGLLTETIREQFDTQGGRTGGWEPLSERYASDKVRRFGSQPILVATGALRDSLLGGPGRIVRQEGNESLLFGTQLGYGSFHQSGTVNMPQRRILDLTNDDRRTMMKMLQRHLFT
jgi:phage gpG-like protein